MVSPPASTTHVVFEKSVLRLIADMWLTRKTSDHAELTPRVNVWMCHRALWEKGHAQPMFLNTRGRTLKQWMQSGRRESVALRPEREHCTCTHKSHTRSDAPWWHTAAFFFSPVGSVSAPKLALRLPVFLCVSVKCIHRLLRGLRLEGDCFRSDKNRLAPKRGAGIVGAGCLWNRQAHCSTALERRPCVRANEKDCHWGVCRNTQALNHTVIDSYFYSQKVKSKHLGFLWINVCINPRHNSHYIDLLRYSVSRRCFALEYLKFTDSKISLFHRYEWTTHFYNSYSFSVAEAACGGVTFKDWWTWGLRGHSVWTTKSICV